MSHLYHFERERDSWKRKVKKGTISLCLSLSLTSGREGISGASSLSVCGGFHISLSRSHTNTHTHTWIPVCAPHSNFHPKGQYILYIWRITHSTNCTE